MAMRDITDLMNAYRECSRHLWNTYFSGKENCGAALDTFSQIQPLLFEGIVDDELNYEDDANVDELLPPPVLKVVPRDRSEILIKRRQIPGQAGYWDEVKDYFIGPEDIELEFVDYFDFGEVGVRDFRYCLCRILTFPSRPEFEGRESLIGAQDVRIFHDESK